MRKICLLMGLLTLVLVGACSEAPTNPVIPEVELVNPVIDLYSNPLGADVSVFQLNTENKAIDMGQLVFTGQTPVVGLELTPGSYIAEFSAQDYDTKIIGLRLAYGDTTVSQTVDLLLSPADPPEIEAVWADFYASADTISLGETFTVTASTNGLLGVLNLDQFQYFMADGAFTFPFTPTETGERLISMVAIGAGGDYAVHNSVVMVRDKPAEDLPVEFNVWLLDDYDQDHDGLYEVFSGEEVEFNYMSAHADSVTLQSSRYSGPIALSGGFSPTMTETDSFVFRAWKDGLVKQEFVFQIIVEESPEMLPQLTFGCSARQVEPGIYEMAPGQLWLTGSVRFYDEQSDYVRVLGVDEDLGPYWIRPATVDSDTSFTCQVTRNGNILQDQTILVRMVENPEPDPEYIDLVVDTPGAWVGQRDEDPKERDLITFEYLPDNNRIEVSACLEYSVPLADQNDESGAIGLVDSFGNEDWALREGEDCQVLPDQGDDSANGIYYLGSIGGHQEGTFVLKTGIEFDCHSACLTKCVNPNSLHCNQLILRIYLNR